LLYPQRAGGISQIYSASHLTHDIDPSIAAPMCITSSRKHAYVMEPCQLASGALVWSERWYLEDKQPNSGSADLQVCGTGLSVSRNGSILAVDHHHRVEFCVSDIVFTAPELKAANPGLVFQGMLYISFS
jgi:hypothetical protein